jgi:hypothetical protein
MDNKLWRTSIRKMRKRIPEFIVLALVPHSTVVVALDKPDFIRGVGTDLVYFAVVADEGFEFAAEGVALDPGVRVRGGSNLQFVRAKGDLPVDHVAPERCAGSDCVVGVNVADVVADVLEDFDEVGVGCAAPVGLDLDNVLVSTVRMSDGDIPYR